MGWALGDWPRILRETLYGMTKLSDALLQLIREGPSLAPEQFLNDLRAQRLAGAATREWIWRYRCCSPETDVGGRPLDQRVVTVNVSRRGAKLQASTDCSILATRFSRPRSPQGTVSSCLVGAEDTPGRARSEWLRSIRILCSGAMCSKPLRRPRSTLPAKKKAARRPTRETLIRTRFTPLHPRIPCGSCSLPILNQSFPNSSTIVTKVIHSPPEGLVRTNL